MKYFLSQPMTGFSKQDIIDARKIIKDIIYKLHPDWECIDSLVFEDPPDNINNDDNIGVYFLGKSIMLLAEADIMVIPDNAYYNSRGCSVEFMISNLYKIPIYLLNINNKSLKLYNIEDDFIDMIEV